ncbi:MAG TPA: ATP-binding protein [Candidatus Limnocylindrales bacterium]|nr:ATP-binding protein [Candidatus Limnocylindrales bacterium]
MINVLHIEDNPGDARLIEEMLREEIPPKYKVVNVMRIKDAVSLLKSGYEVDIILSDITLPDSHGDVTFELLKKVAANRPVVFITGSQDEDLAVQALQQGAQDYLLKGFFDHNALVRSIGYSIERKRFQQEATKAKSEARKLQQEAKLLKLKSEQLAELNEIKDDFISLASHQLRTPATGVKQYVGMILQGFAGEIPEAQQKLLQIAYECNERQLTIVNDLLKVAQIDSGRIEMKRRKIDVEPLLREIIDEQKDSFADKDISIALEPIKHPCTIYADRERIRMAFENVIDNACKYSPRHRAVEVRVLDKPDTTVIEVKDEGVGIDQKDMAKVFEKFSRIYNSLSNTVGGSGLGLYWVKRVVDLHGGSISIRSKLHKGTVFSIELPKRKGNA